MDRGDADRQQSANNVRVMFVPKRVELAPAAWQRRAAQGRSAAWATTVRPQLKLAVFSPAAYGGPPNRGKRVRDLEFGGHVAMRQALFRLPYRPVKVYNPSESGAHTTCSGAAALIATAHAGASAMTYAGSRRSAGLRWWRGASATTPAARLSCRSTVSLPAWLTRILR